MKSLKTTIAMLAITSIAIFTSCKKTSSTNPAASSGGSVTATLAQFPLMLLLPTFQKCQT